jgi:hypothetical protein
MKVVTPPTKLRRTARMSTIGKAPRHCFASRSPVANLNRREYMHAPTKELPGEWDRYLPKKKSRGSSLEWKPSKENLGEKL